MSSPLPLFPPRFLTINPHAIPYAHPHIRVAWVNLLLGTKAESTVEQGLYTRHENVQKGEDMKMHPITNGLGQPYCSEWFPGPPAYRNYQFSWALNVCAMYSHMLSNILNNLLHIIPFLPSQPANS